MLFAPFAAASTLGGGEWFINHDPGTGSGTAFQLAAAATADGSVTIPPSALSGLVEGVHLLGVRVRDNEGQWGHVVWHPFLKQALPETPPAVASLEYNISRNGQIVASGTADAVAPGGVVTIPVPHGKDGLLLDANHRVQVSPIDGLGRKGHSVIADFTYKIYAQAWSEQHFTLAERNNPAISGDDVDADGDGLTNAQERYFALNPRDRGDSALAATAISKSAPGNLLRAASLGDGDTGWTLGFRVPAGGSLGIDGIYRTSDLQYTLSQSMDLGSWPPAPAVSITGWQLTDLGDGAAKLELNVAPNVAEKLFFSLKGEQAAD